MEEKQFDMVYAIKNLLIHKIPISKRGCPDIQTAMAFLTTRVKKPDDDDLKKLQVI